MTDDIGAAAIANDQARIRRATQAIRDLGDDLRPAPKGIEPVMRRITDKLCDMTRQTPLHALAIAFLLGVMIARRP